MKSEDKAGFPQKIGQTCILVPKLLTFKKCNYKNITFENYHQVTTKEK